MTLFQYSSLKCESIFLSFNAGELVILMYFLVRELFEFVLEKNKLFEMSLYLNQYLFWFQYILVNQWVGDFHFDYICLSIYTQKKKKKLIFLTNRGLRFATANISRAFLIIKPSTAWTCYISWKGIMIICQNQVNLTRLCYILCYRLQFAISCATI